MRFLKVFLLIQVVCAGFQANSMETRKRIVVLDTPINGAKLAEPYMCQNGSVSVDNRLSFYAPGDPRLDGHGDNVVGLIGERIDSEKYCIYHIAYYFGRSDRDAYLKALKLTQLVANVEAINMSLGGMDEMAEETAIIKNLNDRDITIVAAAGNNRSILAKNWCDWYPACLQPKVKHPEKFWVVVSGKNGVYSDFSNKSDGYIKIVWENGVGVGSPSMDGTSQATAIRTGKMYSKDYVHGN